MTSCRLAIPRLLPVLAGMAAAPSAPIIVSTKAGSSMDMISRMVAERIAVTMGQPVVLENQAGATGKIPANGAQQLIAYARANTEKLDYTSPGSGTGSHLTGEMFKAMAGVKITHIPYKDTAPAMGDLVGGQVASMFAELGSILPHIRAGKVRALGVTSYKGIAALPDTPTIADALPGFLARPWNGAVAPPNTPAAIAATLALGITESLRQPDVLKRLADRSFEAMGGTPEQMTLFMKQDTERWDKVIRTISLKAD